jgi:hypothetical protein
MMALSPSGGDDAPQIQAAINALPTRGGLIDCSPGEYLIGSTIALGDGTPSSRSTRFGIRVDGQGAAGYWTDFVMPELAPVVWKWTGPAGGTMVKNNGAHGWGLNNIVLHGNNGLAGLGLSIAGAFEGDCSNQKIVDCLNGAALANAGSTPVQSNSMHNTFRNIGVWLHWLSTNGVAILLDGQRAPEGPNTCENLFDHLSIWLPGDRACFGIYLKECDTNEFRQVHMSGGQQAGVAVTFDYGSSNAQPGGNKFVGFEAGGVHTQFQNLGTLSPLIGGPNTMPNSVSLFSTGNGGVFPSVANLVCTDGDRFIGPMLCSRSKAPATGEAGILLAVNRAGIVALSQVKLGATNSGGSGKRALVVDN